MGVIESEEAARRLARVIVSDIEIYNREKFQAGADLTAAIEEGRALFRSRVAPELLPVFTSVLEDRRGASRKSAAAKRAQPAPAEPAPVDRSGAVAAPTRRPAEPARTAATPAPEAAPRPSKPAEPTPRPVAVAVAAPTPVADIPATVASTTPAVASESAAAPYASEAPTAPDAPAPTPAPVPAVAAVAAAKPGARAGAIDTEEAAARLARVILSDIQLYNAKKIASGADLSNEIAEGRHLFKSRVIAELLPVFETTLAAKGLGQRKRAASPAPIPPRAKPPVAAEPIAAAAAPTPRPVAPTPAPAVAARPSISAVKAPPAAQPRPGVTVTRRPTPAPYSVPMAMTEVGSGRHQAPPQSAIPSLIADAGSGQQHAPGAHYAPGAHSAPPGRPGLNLEAPADDEGLTPGAMAGMATGITPPPSEAAHPLVARAITSRPPPTPPPAPHQARVTGPQMRIPTPVPPSAPTRRDRPPSLSEMPIAVDSGPHHLDPAHAAMPPQEVLDALPAPEPLPPLPVRLSAEHPAHHHAPAAQAPELPAAPAAPARLPTPIALPQEPAPIVFAPPPGADGEEVVSLRQGMSKIRLLLTIAALGGAGGAIWYFLLR